MQEGRQSVGLRDVGAASDGMLGDRIELSGMAAEAADQRERACAMSRMLMSAGCGSIG